MQKKINDIFEQFGETDVSLKNEYEIEILKEKYSEKLCNMNEFDCLMENPYIEKIQYLGLSGIRKGRRWYDVIFIDGSAINIYTP